MLQSVFLLIRRLKNRIKLFIVLLWGISSADKEESLKVCEEDDVDDDGIEHEGLFSVATD